jgi:hypothetical protein
MSKYAYSLYLSKNYKKAINIINDVLLKQPDNPTMLRLYAYSLFETNDIKQGLIYIKKFFNIIENDKILPSDYEYYGKLLNKDGQDSLAIIYYLKTISLDKSKYELYGTIAKIYEKQKNYIEAANYYNKLIQNTKNPSPQDYFLLGKSYYFGANTADSINRKNYYIKADSAFMQVAILSPTSHYGNLWRARTSSMLDPDSKNGLAKPFYEEVIKILEQDFEKNKKELIEPYRYLGIYYYLKEDKENAKLYMEKIKSIDPTNKDADDVLKLLNSPSQRRQK